MPLDLAALVDPAHTALVTQKCQQGEIGEKSALTDLAARAPALQLLANLPRRSEWCFPTEQGDLPADLSRPWDRIRLRAKLPRLPAEGADPAPMHVTGGSRAAPGATK